MQGIPFFDVPYEQLLGYFVTFMIFIIPNLGVRLMNAVKVGFSLEGERAQYLILGLVTLFALAAMAVTGAFAEVKWTFTTISTQILAALVPAKIQYKRFKLKEPWVKVPPVEPPPPPQPPDEPER